MTRARDIANLVDANGDIVAGALDNVPASNDASALTTGTLPDGRFPATLPAVSGANLTGINTDLVGDTTPQLGGNLDLNSNDITGTGDMSITGDITATGYVHGGAGTVVQTRVSETRTLTSLNTTSFAEFGTNFRVSITPKYSNSIMLVEVSFPCNPDGAANLLMLAKPVKFVSGGGAQDLSAIGNANGSSNRMAGGGGFRSSNGYDTNDQNIVTFMGYDVPNSTASHQYGFHYLCEGSQTNRINHSAGSTSIWSYTAPTIIRVTEIKV